MATVSQTIPNYYGGISEQPDELKIPGQVNALKNVLPDITYGLTKRPGSTIVGGTMGSETTDSKWFHYYRDENEQYIGQVKLSDGTIKMWALTEVKNSAGQTVHNAGASVTVNYDASTETALKNYLKQTSTDGLNLIKSSDIQTLTLNDLTYFTNRNVICKMKTATEDRAPSRPPEAFIELKKVAYASQYSVNIFDNTTSFDEVHTAIRIDIQRTIDSSNGCKTENPSVGDMPPSGTLPGSTGWQARCNLTAGEDSDSLTPNVATQIFKINHNDPQASLECNGNTDQKFTVSSTKGAWATGTAYVVGDTVTVASTAGDGSDTSKMYVAMTAATSSGDTAPSHTSGEVDIGGIKWQYYGKLTDRKNLYFRITTLGQSVAKDQSDSDDIYRARYTTTFDLLYGGEGWRAGDWFYVWMKNARYTVTIKEHNISKIQGNLGVIRPTPTSFDTKTTTTSEAILGGVRTAIMEGQTANDIADDEHFKDSDGALVEQIGNGLYLTRTSGTFNITTGVSTLFNVFSNTIKDITDLPSQCKNDYIVKIANSVADEDDYFVQFKGVNGRDGPGTWEECPEPGRKVAIDPATMPIQMIRESNGTFTVSQCQWDDCLVGDDVTVAEPSFMKLVDGEYEGTINKMLFFRNRMVLLSDENVNMSRPGDFFNYWPKTAVTFTATDNVDLECSSEFPAVVYDGIQVNTGLLLFTKNQQFMLTTDSDVLSPNTAKINALATYNFNHNTSPISMGTTVAFLDNAGKYSRFFEITAVLREGQPEVLEQSKPVSKSFPKEVDIIANSRENSIVFFAKTGTNKIYSYRYFSGIEKRLQQAWFQWEVSGAIQHMAMLDDALFVVIRNHDKDSLQKFNIKIDEDSSTLKDSDEALYRIHLDNYKSIPHTSVSYNSDEDYTHFTLPEGFNNSHLEGTCTKIGNVITVTSTAHEFTEGQKVNLEFQSDGLTNGNYTVLTVPDANNFNVLSIEQDGTNSIASSSVVINALTGALVVTPGDDPDTTMQGLFSPTTTYKDDDVTKVKIPGNFKSYERSPAIHEDDGVVAGRVGDVLVLDFTNWIAADTDRTKHPFKVGDVINCDFASDITDGNVTIKSVPDNETAIASTASGSTVSSIKVAISSPVTPEQNIVLGYLFDMEVDFPRLYKYERGAQEGTFRTDVHNKLIIHRVKFSLGDSGVYDFEISPKGKDPYTERVEIINPNDYLANTLAVKKEARITVPIYEKNINVDLKLKSTHPTPATLYSMTWEGDSTDGYYKRV